MNNIFNPETDIPSLEGKVVFITGGTSGIGAATVVQIAKHYPAAIYFSGRSATSAATVTKQVHEIAPSVKLVFVECDLASLGSVKTAAEQFLAQSDRLDVLICNAGIMAVPMGVTRDGYEIQFGVNHLGHALLIKKLLPLLLDGLPGADKRLISLASDAYRLHPCAEGIIFDKLKTPQDMGVGGPLIRYGQSKLANIVYARELARRYPDLLSVSVHPGVVKTGLQEGGTPAMRMLSRMWNITGTPDEGALNTLWAAFAKRSGVVNGQLYEPVGVASKMDKAAMDDDLAKKLWDWTARELIGF